MPNIPIITIDGPSGAGKGTISQSVARSLQWHYLDSGALYRIVAFASLEKNQDLADEAALITIAQGMVVKFQPGKTTNDAVVLLNQQDITASIRTEVCGNAASKVAALPGLRAALLDWQREYLVMPGLVADGRDMGTAIFPEAQIKVFLTASANERAIRRHNQLKEKGIDVSLPELKRDVAERDARDMQRSASPLRAADDAHVIDSTTMSIDDVVNNVLSLAKANL